MIPEFVIHYERIFWLSALPANFFINSFMVIDIFNLLLLLQALEKCFKEFYSAAPIST